MEISPNEVTSTAHVDTTFSINMVTVPMSTAPSSSGVTTMARPAAPVGPEVEREAEHDAMTVPLADFTETHLLTANPIVTINSCTVETTGTIADTVATVNRDPYARQFASHMGHTTTTPMISIPVSTSRLGGSTVGSTPPATPPVPNTLPVPLEQNGVNANRFVPFTWDMGNRPPPTTSQLRLFGANSTPTSSVTVMATPATLTVTTGDGATSGLGDLATSPDYSIMPTGPTVSSPDYDVPIDSPEVIRAELDELSPSEGTLDRVPLPLRRPYGYRPIMGTGPIDPNQGVTLPTTGTFRTVDQNLAQNTAQSFAYNNHFVPITDSPVPSTPMPGQWPEGRLPFPPGFEPTSSEHVQTTGEALAAWNPYGESFDGDPGEARSATPAEPSSSTDQTEAETLTTREHNALLRLPIDQFINRIRAVVATTTETPTEIREREQIEADTRVMRERRAEIRRRNESIDRAVTNLVNLNNRYATKPADIRQRLHENIAEDIAEFEKRMGLEEGPLTEEDVRRLEDESRVEPRPSQPLPKYSLETSAWLVDLAGIASDAGYPLSQEQITELAAASPPRRESFVQQMVAQWQRRDTPEVPYPTAGTNHPSIATTVPSLHPEASPETRARIMAELVAPVTNRTPATTIAAQESTVELITISDDSIEEIYSNLPPRPPSTAVQRPTVKPRDGGTFCEPSTVATDSGSPAKRSRGASTPPRRKTPSPPPTEAEKQSLMDRVISRHGRPTPVIRAPPRANSQPPTTTSRQTAGAEGRSVSSMATIPPQTTNSFAREARERRRALREPRQPGPIGRAVRAANSHDPSEDPIQQEARHRQQLTEVAAAYVPPNLPPLESIVSTSPHQSRVRDEMTIAERTERLRADQMNLYNQMVDLNTPDLERRMVRGGQDRAIPAPRPCTPPPRRPARVPDETPGPSHAPIAGSSETASASQDNNPNLDTLGAIRGLLRSVREPRFSVPPLNPPLPVRGTGPENYRAVSGYGGVIAPFDPPVPSFSLNPSITGAAAASLRNDNRRHIRFHEDNPSVRAYRETLETINRGIRTHQEHMLPETTITGDNQRRVRLHDRWRRPTATQAELIDPDPDRPDTPHWIEAITASFARRGVEITPALVDNLLNTHPVERQGLLERWAAWIPLDNGRRYRPILLDPFRTEEYFRATSVASRFELLYRWGYTARNLHPEQNDNFEVYNSDNDSLLLRRQTDRASGELTNQYRVALDAQIRTLGPLNENRHSHQITVDLAPGLHIRFGQGYQFLSVMEVEGDVSGAAGGASSRDRSDPQPPTRPRNIRNRSPPPRRRTPLPPSNLTNRTRDSTRRQPTCPREEGTRRYADYDDLERAQEVRRTLRENTTPAVPPSDISEQSSSRHRTTSDEHNITISSISSVEPMEEENGPITPFDPPNWLIPVIAGFRRAGRPLTPEEQRQVFNTPRNHRQPLLDRWGREAPLNARGERYRAILVEPSEMAEYNRLTNPQARLDWRVNWSRTHPVQPTVVAPRTVTGTLAVRDNPPTPNVPLPVIMNTPNVPAPTRDYLEASMRFALTVQAHLPGGVSLTMEQIQQYLAIRNETERQGLLSEWGIVPENNSDPTFNRPADAFLVTTRGEGAGSSSTPDAPINPHSSTQGRSAEAEASAITVDRNNKVITPGFRSNRDNNGLNEPRVPINPRTI